MASLLPLTGDTSLSSVDDLVHGVVVVALLLLAVSFGSFWVQSHSWKHGSMHKPPTDPLGYEAVTDIDRRTCTRTVPMRVLVLGLPRTGTHSIRLALKRLGYNTTYHGYTAALENPRDCEMWLDALNAKINGKGKPFGREEFDQLLGHCQAVTDVPAVCFAPELIKAYPEAKVILSTRDVDTWHKSVMHNIIARVYDPKAAFVSHLARVFYSPSRWSRPTFLQVWEGYFRGFSVNGKAVFHEHYALVRSLVPAENLLEYRVQQGWGPLCEFLGDPTPEVPFPRGNEEEEIARRISGLVRVETNKAVRNCGGVVSIIIALWWSWFALLRG